MENAKVKLDHVTGRLTLTIPIAQKSPEDWYRMSPTKRHVYAVVRAYKTVRTLVEELRGGSVEVDVDA